VGANLARRLSPGLRIIHPLGWPACIADKDVFVNWLDYVVLITTMVGIAVYGVWRTRGRRDLTTYLKGAPDTPWFVIGLSVIATQASAITFLSTPGRGYESGLGIVQNYFGAPFALIIIASVFIPIYRRLNVYTAYEFLGTRSTPKRGCWERGFFSSSAGSAPVLPFTPPPLCFPRSWGGVSTRRFCAAGCSSYSTPSWAAAKP
jgi:hypothetical protein